MTNMYMPDDERSYEFTPDSDLRKEFLTHRTQFFMVRRLRSNGQILFTHRSDNVATASMWLKYDSKPVVTWTDEDTGEMRSYSTGTTTKDVYEVSMDRGIRQVGATA